MKKQYREALFVVGALVAIGLMYIPFRLLAQRCNTDSYEVITGITREFYFTHWFSVGIWPTYALLCGLIPMLGARWVRVRWWLTIPLLIVAFALWDNIMVCDDWLNIPDGGLSGFRLYPINHLGMNTPHLSVILCPIAFIAGAVGGIIAGHILTKVKQSDVAHVK